MNLESDNEKAGKFTVKTDLRMGHAEVESENFAFEVRLKKVHLNLDLEGFEISPRSRYGEPRKENEVVAKRIAKNHRSFRTKGKTETCAKLSPTQVSLTANASANIEGELVHSQQIEMKVDDVHWRVKAQAGDRWLVSEEDGSPLSDTYLEDESLCQLTHIKGSNRNSATLRAIAKQRDCHFTSLNPPGIVARFTNTQEKMLKIFLAKAMSYNRKLYTGWVELSEVEQSFE
jgi:hypothetical protein